MCAVVSCHPGPSEESRVKGQNQLPLRTPPQHPSLAGCDGYSTQHLATVGGRRYRLQPPSRRGERASSSSSCLRTSWRWSSPSSRRLTRAPSTRAGVVRSYLRWYRPWEVVLLSVQGSLTSPLGSYPRGDAVTSVAYLLDTNRSRKPPFRKVVLASLVGEGVDLSPISGEAHALR